MPVFIISDNDQVAARIREALTFTGRDCPSSNVFGVDDAPQRLRRESTVELLVVAISGRIETCLDLLPLVRGFSTKILVVGSTPDPKCVLRILRAGADDYIDLADLEAELDSTLRSMASSSAGEEPGRIIALLSPNGGSGSSTLAVNIAISLAQEHKNVALIDLKLESGDLATLLDVSPSFSLADLCRHSARLDRVMFERSLVKHELGVHLLAPPLHFTDIGYITPEGVRQALVMAQEIFPYVLVDLDHSFREEQMAALSAADIILIVLRLEFTSLRNTRRTIEHLEAMHIDTKRIRLVVNRYGQAKEVPAAKAEEALGMKIFHYVPDDPKTVNRANNHGIPVVIDAPTTRVSRSVQQLAKNVNGRHRDAEAKETAQ
jgi:pilus assembly protein CpaE